MPKEPPSPVPPSPQADGKRPIICLDPNEFQGDATWHLDAILKEFIEGFRFLLPLKREVTIFGSTRLPLHSRWAREAETLAHMLAERGYTIITGGGPGVMEAANKGALDGCTNAEEQCSVGIDINLPAGERRNPYVRRRIAFDYFFTRKVMLSASAQAYVFFPGGFGTLDELTEIITLIQTKKMEKVPTICVGRAFWDPFKAWMREAMLEQETPLIGPADLDLFPVADSAAEALPMIETSTERKFF